MGSQAQAPRRKCEPEFKILILCLGSWITRSCTLVNQCQAGTTSSLLWGWGHTSWCSTTILTLALNRSVTTHPQEEKVPGASVVWRIEPVASHMQDNLIYLACLPEILQPCKSSWGWEVGWRNQGHWAIPTVLRT